MAKKRALKHHTGKRHKLPKKPKKPKASASIRTWEAYDARYKSWEHKCKLIHDNARKKEALVKKYMHR